MTIRALEKEVLELPPKSRARFAEKIIASIDDYAGPEIEKAWTQEIGRRVTEIKSGKTRGIPAGEVMAKARRALHEIRRLSPASLTLNWPGREPSTSADANCLAKRF